MKKTILILGLLIIATAHFVVGCGVTNVVEPVGPTPNSTCPGNELTPYSCFLEEAVFEDCECIPLQDNFLDLHSEIDGEVEMVKGASSPDYSARKDGDILTLYFYVYPSDLKINIYVEGFSKLTPGTFDAEAFVRKPFFYIDTKSITITIDNIFYVEQPEEYDCATLLVGYVEGSLNIDETITLQSRSGTQNDETHDFKLSGSFGQKIVRNGCVE